MSQSTMEDNKIAVLRKLGMLDNALQSLAGIHEDDKDKQEGEDKQDRAEVAEKTETEKTE